MLDHEYYNAVRDNNPQDDAPPVPGRPNWDEFPVSVELRFRSQADREHFMGQLSDGFGEAYCNLEWPWAAAPRGPHGETLGFNEQSRFAVEVMGHDF